MRERPRKTIGHCFAAAGLFLLTLVSEMAQAAKVETVTFQTNIIPKTHEQPVKVIAKLILSGYLFKVVYEALATPLTYAIVNFLKRREGVDTFDRSTDFNPFRRALDEPGLE